MALIALARQHAEEAIGAVDAVSVAIHTIVETITSTATVILEVSVHFAGVQGHDTPNIPRHTTMIVLGTRLIETTIGTNR